MFFYLLLAMLLCIHFHTDRTKRLLYDSVSGMIFGLGLVLVWQSEQPILHAITIGTVFFIAVISLFLSSVSGGDIKLLFALSPWFTPNELLVFLGCFLLFTLILSLCASLSMVASWLRLTEEEKTNHRLPLGITIAIGVFSTEALLMLF